jgi:hypothetical protein
LLTAVIGCGGNVNSTHGATWDAATVTDAAADQFAEAGMTQLTSPELAQLQSSACYQPGPIEISTDGGPSNCSFVVPTPVKGMSVAEFLTGCPEAVLWITLSNGQPYLIAQSFDNCSTGGVSPGPSTGNYAILCPNACSLIEQNGGGMLRIFKDCKGCSIPP